MTSFIGYWYPLAPPFKWPMTPEMSFDLNEHLKEGVNWGDEKYTFCGDFLWQNWSCFCSIFVPLLVEYSLHPLHKTEQKWDQFQIAYQHHFHQPRCKLLLCFNEGCLIITTYIFGEINILCPFQLLWLEKEVQAKLQ